MIRSKAGIYQLHNEDKNIYYIGQSSDLQKRKRTHFRELKKGNHFCKELQDDFINGDNIVYSVIIKCPDYERLLLSEEARYIEQYQKAGKKLYNRRGTVYNYMVDDNTLLHYIANSFCWDHFGKTYTELTLGKNPARFDYLFRMIFDKSFDAESNKSIYLDIGYYYLDNAKCDIKGGEL